MKQLLFICLLLCQFYTADAQSIGDPFLTIDRIYDTGEFRQEGMKPIKWIDGGNSYVIIEKGIRGNELIRYNSATQEKDVFISATELKDPNTQSVITIEDFSLSSNESKVLIFTNSSRVWRSNTKGDYWVYDLDTKRLTQIG